MDAIGQIHDLAVVSLDLEHPVKSALTKAQSEPSEERTGFSRNGTRMLDLPHVPVIVMTVLSYYRTEVFN
jgi:hypothetical protein